MSAKRDTAWGPMDANREAAVRVAEALAALGFEIELREPNLPWLAPEGEAKELVKRAKEEGAEAVWRGDSFVLLRKAERLPEILERCRDEYGFVQLYDLTAVDPAADAPHLHLLYGLRNLKLKSRLVVQIELPKDALQVASVAHLYRAADWHEREAAEMYGITFVGHPDPRNMLLPDDWVGYPLRKDYEYPEEYHGISCS